MYLAVGAPPPLVAGATAAGASGVMAGMDVAVKCVTVEYVTVQHVSTLPLAHSTVSILSSLHAHPISVRDIYLHCLSVLTRS
jgi:hypothetical protein